MSALTEVQAHPGNSAALPETPNAGTLQGRTVEDLRPEINALESKLNKKQCLLVIAMIIVLLAGVSLINTGVILSAATIPFVGAFPILFTGVGLVGAGIVIGVVLCSLKLSLNPYARRALDDKDYHTFMAEQKLILHLNTLTRTYRVYKKQQTLTRSLEYIDNNEHRRKHRELLDFRRTFHPSVDAIQLERGYLGSAGRSLSSDTITEVIRDRRSNEFVRENSLLLNEDFSDKTDELNKQLLAINQEIKAIKALVPDTIEDNRLALHHWSEKDKD